MRTLLHISDFHFGAVDEATLEPLRKAAIELRPDLTIVSGDLTQRARAEQYRQARHFMETLPGPRLVVPGNHDVPLHNVFARFLTPLRNYKRFIDENPEPYYEDPVLSVLGLNSARSLTFQDGRLNDEQIARITRTFGPQSSRIKVLVTHHPLVLPPGSNKELVDKAEQALAAMAAAKADLVLTGHLHTSHFATEVVRSPNSSPGSAGEVPSLRGGGGWHLLHIQAGTATSTRQRGQLPSFNHVHIDPPHISIDHHLWNPATKVFEATAPIHFKRTGAGWTLV